MSVEMSSLTGEPIPCKRNITCNKPEDILETQNVAFFSTLCVEGSGTGIVFLTGDDTIIGNIA